MKVLRVLLLTAVAVCAFGAASAQAALPEFAGEFPDGFKAASTGPKFEAAGGAIVVECEKSEGEGTITGAKTGSFDELFLGCTGKVLGISVGKCTGLTDTITGSILAKGTSTLGFELGTLIPVAALSIESLHFECGSTLAVVTGCLVGTTTLGKENAKKEIEPSTTGELLFKGSGGKQEFTDYTNDKGEMVSCKLSTSVNGGEAKESNQIQHAVLTFVKAVQVKD
ncbi:MAG TPA: hypothetical protein VH061_10320 [Solirubrobacteraceae bacterium]|jgi:hypothetical protein|nr:hypothetical protein [Solirubrobacteraceae bacterium]